MLRVSQTSRSSYPQYPNFVNNPDEAIWPSAPTPIVSVSTASFCRSGVTQVAFTTRSDETGSFDILIDFNNDGIRNNNDVLLQQTLVAGTANTVVWNGLDAVGMRATAGDVINYKFTSNGAAVHFPVYDAEGKPDVPEQLSVISKLRQQSRRGYLAKCSHADCVRKYRFFL